MARAALLLVLAVVLAAFAAAGCGLAGDSDALRKDLDEMRADYQRLAKDNQRLKEELASAEQRLGGLATDVAHVQQVVVAPASAGGGQAAMAVGGDLSSTVNGTPAAAAPGAAPAGGVSAQPAGSLGPEAAGIKAYLATEEGRKVFADAMRAYNDQQNADRTRRAIDSAVDRFAKQASLTDDQTKRMKDLLNAQALQRRDAFAPLRDLGPETTPEDREQARKDAQASVDAARKQADDQLRNLLSTQQFEMYEQQQAQLRSPFQGTGGAARTGRRQQPAGQGAGGSK